MYISKPLPSKQVGFVLIGLMIALAVSSVLGAIAINRSLVEVENTLAEGSGVYLSEVAGATEQFVFQNWYEYANEIDIPGLADDLKPTIAELVVDGKRLLPSFPTSLPTRQEAEIFITKTNCPGADCLVTALTCTSTPITFGRATVRFDLAGLMMTSQHGIGGQSRSFDPGNIVGPTLNMENPYGNVAGIVCASARVDTALMMQFVRMGDTRDPFLRGDLTAKGDISAGGDSGGPCARTILGSDGRITSNRADCSRAVEVNADQGRLTAFDASGVPTAEVNGDQGRVTAKLLRTTTTYFANTLCGPALEGDIGLDANSRFGLVVCRTGMWRRVGMEMATSGGACSPEGAVGQDSNGIAYVCRGATWQSLSGRLPRSIPFQRYLVADATSVPVPTTCPASTTPAILLRGIDGVMDNTVNPARNRFAHYAENSGANWTVRLVVFDSNGTRYSSSAGGVPYGMRAIAEVNCDFIN